MADGKLSEQQVADLLTILRGDASLDAKVQFVTTVKSGIKQHNVPEVCVAQLFDGLRAASASQHAALVNAGFTALGHLLTRLSRQDPKLLAKEAARTLPLVVDKLGDHKDKYRALAAHALSILYPVAPADVERVLRNSALSGKNSRAKEAGMHWLLQVCPRCRKRRLSRRTCAKPPDPDAQGTGLAVQELCPAAHGTARGRGWHGSGYC